MWMTLGALASSVPRMKSAALGVALLLVVSSGCKGKSSGRASPIASLAQPSASTAPHVDAVDRLEASFSPARAKRQQAVTLEIKLGAAALAPHVVIVPDKELPGVELRRVWWKRYSDKPEPAAPTLAATLAAHPADLRPGDFLVLKVTMVVGDKTPTGDHVLRLSLPGHDKSATATLTVD